MTLPPLHLPLISAGFFGGIVSRMLTFVALRIRRSDQGMWPSLSPDLRAQTVALHRRLTVLTRAFHRLAELARQGRLRVYPDRKSPGARGGGAGRGTPAVSCPPQDTAFGVTAMVAQGPTLPAAPTRGFGWMLGFVPAEYGPAIAALLTNAEMVSLIQASPAVARLLRPLCRGLGVVPPEGVFPPSRRRASRARPGLRPGAGDGASSKPARVSRRAVVAEAVMSPGARDRWWASKRAAGMGTGERGGASVGRGGCAKS